MWNKDFLELDEIKLSTSFQRDGYVIRPVSDIQHFFEVRKLVVEKVADFLGVRADSPEHFLNNIHENLRLGDLNKLRLEVIRSINAEEKFRSNYFRLARETLETLVGNELAMQVRVNLSIQLPQDDSSLLPVHADVWSGDSPFEVVVWVPLVDCYGTKAMYILPPKSDEKLRQEFSQYASGNSENLFRRIEQEVVWIEIKAGEVLIFNQNLPHGNRVNDETETRWSMNCRFKGVFTPYGEKKLGEFFEPITLKTATRIGISYRFPSLKDGADR
jgi:sporadic carbohydrate cluster 2OG-Fe(II) oxygenase